MVCFSTIEVYNFGVFLEGNALRFVLEMGSLQSTSMFDVLQ